MARFAYAAGVDPISLLLFRFTTAGLLMLLLLRLKGQRLPRGGRLLGPAAMGAIGYFGQSLCYFTALTLAPASLVALLLYLYPALVAGQAAIFLKDRLSKAKIGALIIATLGAGLVIAPLGTPQSGTGPPVQPLGIILAFSAAIIYSIYIVVGSRIIKDVPPAPTAAIIMLSAAISFGGLAGARALTGGGGLSLPNSTAGWAALIGLSLIATVIAVVTFLSGMERIGPTNASLVSTLEPLVSVALAALLLGEALTIPRTSGGLLIVLAVVLLTVRERSRVSSTLAPAVPTNIKQDD